MAKLESVMGIVNRVVFFLVIATRLFCQQPTWTDAAAALTPSSRQYAAAAYDAIRQQVVVFGGNLNDTWAWK
jgi:hypothetical protein